MDKTTKAQIALIAIIAAFGFGACGFYIWIMVLGIKALCKYLAG